MWPFKPRKLSKEKLAKFLRDFYGKCPACQNTLEGHHLQELASAVMEPSNESTVMQLEAAISEHRWRDAWAIHEFEGLKDALVYSLIKCPHTQSLLLYRKLSYAELYLNDTLTPMPELSHADQELLATVVTGEWFSL